MHLRTLILFALMLGLVGALGMLMTWDVSTRSEEQDVQFLKSAVRDMNCPTCVADVIADVAATEDLTAAMHMVKSWYKAVPGSRKDCHFLTMELANELSKKVPDYTTLKLPPESVWCDYGLIQSYPRIIFSQSGNIEDARAFCAFVGKQLGTHVQQAEAECFRTVGQLVPFLDPSLQGSARSIAEASVDWCAEHASGEGGYLKCVAGVFFSIGKAMSAGDFGLHIAVGNPLWLCDEQDENILNACRSNLVKDGVLSVAKSHPEESLYEQYAEVLRTFPGISAKWVPELMWVLAYESARKQMDNDNLMNAAVSECTASGNTFIDECVQGFAFGIAKHGLPGEQGHAMISFCAAVAQKLPIDRVRCASKAVVYLVGARNAASSQALCSELKKVLNVSCDDVSLLIPSA